MTSQTILETLANNLETLSTTLNPDEKDQFVALLSKVAGTEEDHAVEDAVDALFDFCLKLPFLRERLKKADANIFYLNPNRGEPKPKPLSEQEKQVRLIASRLMQALQESQEKDKKQR